MKNWTDRRFRARALLLLTVLPLAACGGHGAGADVDLAHATIDGSLVLHATAGQLQGKLGKPVASFGEQAIRETFRLRSGATVDILLLGGFSNEPLRARSIVFRDRRVTDATLGRFLDEVGPTFAAYAERKTHGALRGEAGYRCVRPGNCSGTLSAPEHEWRISYGKVGGSPYLTQYLP